MNLTFEISGTCVVKGAEYKANEHEVAEIIERILAEELDVIASISVKYIREE